MTQNKQQITAELMQRAASLNKQISTLDDSTALTPLIELAASVHEDLIILRYLYNQSEFTPATQVAVSSNDEYMDEDTEALIDELKSVHPEINDAVADREKEPAIEAEVEPETLRDLKKYIGLNDRIAFINVLFNGDAGAYEDAVSKINRMQNPEAFQSSEFDFPESAEQDLFLHYVKRFFNE